MAQFLSDTEVAERILTHVDKGTTDRTDRVWQEPVDHYLSTERFAQEMEVFKKALTVVCPSAALKDIGSYISPTVAQTPLIVVRGKDGVVRAFKNACRHRGAQLVSGEGCTQAFVCPYHGWAYRLDGPLQSVPHEDGFPGLDKTQKGLVEVKTMEQGGLVFVQLHETDESDDALAGVSDLLSDDQHLLQSGQSVIDANWKVHLESFLEGYHIKYAHPETFYPYGYDNLNVVETCGRNARVTFPFRRIEKLKDVPAKSRTVDGKLTYVYHLFPNTLVTVLSNHTNIVVLSPVDLKHTAITVYQLTNRQGGADAVERAKRDASFVSDTGALEDIALVTSIQKSIESEANDVFTFGHFEGAITHFHRNLSGLLGDA